MEGLHGGPGAPGAAGKKAAPGGPGMGTISSKQIWDDQCIVIAIGAPGSRDTLAGRSLTAAAPAHEDESVAPFANQGGMQQKPAAWLGIGGKQLADIQQVYYRHFSIAGGPDRATDSSVPC